MPKKINLTQGKVTIVDDEDYKELSKFKWYCHTGYAARDIWNKEFKKSLTVFMHRIISKVKSNNYIDHINGNKLDNRRSNLRICTNAENIRNSKIKNTNTSGYKGVHYHKQAKKWEAYIHYNYNKIYLGLFNIKEDAALAYNKKAKELFGEFARLNEVK